MRKRPFLTRLAELTPEQIAEIREVFDYFDEDKDGALTLKEFQDGCGMALCKMQTFSNLHIRPLDLETALI